MPDPATPDAPAGTPQAPDPKATPKGTEGDGGKGPATPAPEPNVEMEKLERRNADQQAEISRQQGARAQVDRQNADLQAELERLRSRTPAPGATPQPSRFQEAIDNLDGGALEQALEEKIMGALTKVAPTMQRSAADVSRVERLMEGARAIDPDVQAADLAAVHQSATPDDLTLLKILREGGQAGLEKKLVELREERESKADAAKLLGTMADGLRKGQRLDTVLGLHPPGEGEGEDEVVNFMHDMGKAPHARVVKKATQWVDDEHSSQR